MRGPVLAALALLTLAACASSGAFRAGRKAERRGQLDRAVVEYARAVKNAPGNITYRKTLDRARLRASEAHLHASRRHAARGLRKEAIEELRLAIELQPEAQTLREELRQLEKQGRVTDFASELAALKTRVHERPFTGLAPSDTAQRPLTLTLTGAPVREAYQALGKLAGINFIFDPQVLDLNVNLSLKDVSFEQAINALGAVARTFHRVIDSRGILVLPDTPTKRRENEQQVVRTFYLSNAELKDAIDLLRVVLAARRVAPVPGTNAFTINDTPEKVAAAERIIAMIDQRRAEVVVDVEILEINRALLKDYGIEFTSGISGIDGIAGGIFPRPELEEAVKDDTGKILRDYQGLPLTVTRAPTLNDNPYKASNLIVSSLPGVIYRLLQTDSSTRLLASPRLRITEGQSAKARFGDQVPVPVTVFAPVAQGGLAQQPVTSFEYKNVGVNIDLTPRVHHDGDISLTLKLEISAVAGTGYQGLPSFSTRLVETVIRLREGETNVLAGLISDSERSSMTGLPGLSSLPVVGSLFGRTHREGQQTDIIMTLTPHVVARARYTEEELKSFLLGGETTPATDVPPAPSVPTPTPRPEAPRVEPIRAPSSTATPSAPPER
jgi:general secretion pathway protein D